LGLAGRAELGASGHVHPARQLRPRGDDKTLHPSLARGRKRDAWVRRTDSRGQRRPRRSSGAYWGSPTCHGDRGGPGSKRGRRHRDRRHFHDTRWRTRPRRRMATARRPLRASRHRPPGAADDAADAGGDGLMGALVGLCFGVGVLLIWRSGPRRPARVRREPRPGVRELLAQAGYQAITPTQLQLTCAATGVIIGTLVAAVSGSVTIAVAFASFAAYGPIALLKVRKRQRQADMRGVWPDVVDNLVSAVRAGMSLPEAIGQL